MHERALKITVPAGHGVEVKNLKFVVDGCRLRLMIDQHCDPKKSVVTIEPYGQPAQEEQAPTARS